MNSIRISHIGLNEWESVFVETTVNIASGIEIASWDYVNEPESADVLLVPNDKMDGELPDLPSYAQEGVNRPITQRIARPVTYTDLIAVLRNAEELVRSARTVVAQQPVAEPLIPDLVDTVDLVEGDAVVDGEPQAEEQFRPARRFVEETRFLGLIGDVLRRRRTTEITHPDFPSVTIFPLENAYTSLGDPMMIPAMFRASSLEFFKREIGDVIASVMLTIDQKRPLFQLVYCAALFGSEGRLFPHSDPNDLVFLVDEPDFGSVPYTAEHRNLARQMLDGPASIAGIAKFAGVDIHTVIDFCNACEAVGLIRKGVSPDSETPGRVRHLYQSF